MTIRKHMTPNPEAIGRDTTVAEAIRLMSKKGIRHLLITDGDQLTGIVSRRELDILTGIQTLNPDRASVELAMTPEPFQVDENKPLGPVVSYMAEARVGSVVVLANDKPVGIFTTVDALRVLASMLKEENN